MGRCVAEVAGRNVGDDARVRDDFPVGLADPAQVIAKPEQWHGRPSSRPRAGNPAAMTRIAAAPPGCPL